MPAGHTRAIRIERGTLADAAAEIPDRALRETNATPSYLHANPAVPWLFWKRLDAVTELLQAGSVRYHAGLDFGCGLGVLLPTLSGVTRQVYATDLLMAPARHLAAALHLDNVQFVEPDALNPSTGLRASPSTSLRASPSTSLRASPSTSLRTSPSTSLRTSPSTSLWISAMPPLDYVVSTDVLEHVEDLDGTLQALGAALKPGGTLVISGPTENAIYKLGRVLVGFGGKGDYHLTNIHHIHDRLCDPDMGFRMNARRVLPLPGIVEAFYIYSYTR